MPAYAACRHCCCFDDEDSRQWLSGRNVFPSLQPSVSMRKPFTYVPLTWTSNSTFLERLRMNSESSMMRTFLRASLVSGAIAFWMMTVPKSSVNLRQWMAQEFRKR